MSRDSITPASTTDHPRPPIWSYTLTHYPEHGSDALAKTPEDAIGTALAVQRVALLMAEGMKSADLVEDGDEELLSHLALYGWAWTRHASELLTAERAATAVPAPSAPSQTGKVTDLMDGLKRSTARRKAGA